MARPSAGMTKRSRTSSPGSKTKTSSAEELYQLKTTLRGIRPPIWRRLLVGGNTSLADLHLIIQISMGWMGGHLHLFTVGTTTYSDFRMDPLSGFDSPDDEDERRVRLREVARMPGDKFRYRYDMGDSWEHEIRVEKIRPPEPGEVYPICLKGARACPPEDCGGVWGYESLLEALADPSHPEHDDLEEWVGGHFDSEAWDLERVNRQLRGLA